MINEELVNELIRHRNEVQNDFGWNTTLQTALDAAIDALKAEPCEDAVSREAVLEVVNNPLNIRLDKIIEGLPPVTPKQRTGTWIGIDEEPHETWECGLCGFVIDAGSWRNPEACRDSYKYCPNCGAKMEGESNETAD